MSTIDFRKLSKSFFNVEVLHAVDLSINSGEVLGLVGENGAGKSTLMNILGGNLQQDSGDILLDGSPISPPSPRDALRLGIAMVHQELNLFPNLSIAENLFLVNFPNSAGFIRRRDLNDKAREALQRVGLDVPPKTLVGSLSSGQQQLVEIARALAQGANVLLFDEPTTSLGHRDCDNLYKLLRELASSGYAVVLITHALADALEHCDRIAVLRDGVLVEDTAADALTPPRLVNIMVGKELNLLFPDRTRKKTSSEPLLQVDQVSHPQTVEDVSFQVHGGEVVGIFGLVGSGRTELARMLAGLDRNSDGAVIIGGQPHNGKTRARIEAGLGYVTESRREDGICSESSVRDNLTLVALDRLATGLFGGLNRKQMDNEVAGIRKKVLLQAHLSDQQQIKTLSGGNQQKIVIGKWLMRRPSVLILDEPTRGIDVAAKQEIYELIHQMANDNAGVLAISSDLDELIGTCDRILVMSLGRIVEEFSDAPFDRNTIMEAAFQEYS